MVQYKNHRAKDIVSSLTTKLTQWLGFVDALRIATDCVELGDATEELRSTLGDSIANVVSVTLKEITIEV